jgi:hypothetical protein
VMGVEQIVPALVAQSDVISGYIPTTSTDAA